MLPPSLLPSLMLLPSHQFQKLFHLPTPIQTSLNSYRIGRRAPTFLLQPSGSVPDLPQAPSTFRDPSRPFQPSSTFINLSIRATSSIFSLALFDPPGTSPTLPGLIRTNHQHIASPFSHLCFQQLIECIRSRDEVQRIGKPSLISLHLGGTFRFRPDGDRFTGESLVLTSGRRST
jgi:hypothetical protein